jgi:hypothetical protein
MKHLAAKIRAFFQPARRQNDAQDLIDALMEWASYYNFDSECQRLTTRHAVMLHLTNKALRAHRIEPRAAILSPDTEVYKKAVDDFLADPNRNKTLEECTEGRKWEYYQPKPRP